MDQQKQEHWWQSVEITSAEEYSQVTSKLAAELLGESTPEELAEIAATHMIYVNALENLRTEQEKRLQYTDELLKAGVPTKEVARYAKTVLEAWREKQTQGRMTALQLRNKAKSAAIERAGAIATELWQADADHEFNLLGMAGQVEDILRREGFEELPKLERIKEWIRPVAPDHARKPGRRRKTL
ncbi:hypothetical protein [Geopseudomonas aromaticivorans]